MKKLSVLAVFVAGFAIACAAPGNALPVVGTAPALVLPAKVQVGAGGLFLHELCGESSAFPTNILLAPAPRVGQTVVLTREQIAETARRTQPSVILSNWTGSTQVQVTRRTRNLEGPELKTLLTALLQKDYVHDIGELELRLSQPWSPIPVPDQELSVRVMDLPASGLSSNFILRFELQDQDQPIGVYQVPLQAKIWREIWVARSLQPRGRLLRDADLTLEKRDILQQRDALIAASFEDSPFELAQTLSPGSPLVTRSVKLRAIIQRGKVLDAVVNDGPLQITVKVEALEDGTPGQLIRVRNAKSKREFRGKVQNETTVTVAI